MAVRLSVLVLIFLVSTNAFAVLVDATQMDQQLGTDPGTCDPQSLVEAEKSAEQVDPGAAGDTLFSTYINVADTFASLLGGLSPAAAMWNCVGVPSELTTFMFAGLPILGAVDLIAFIRGFNL